ncbi:hypothetical protein HPB52_004619 [Rhipicephalus sanguineus]|uniref:Uncharacterized protein n=1 Tax=Rhipicephalus sanguineus TaxID=34632 RepID=A0A9D4SXK1_RHISA|nr:hypothetical protein HPB52_004619 [Rhipicephalus sanguineus]
MDRRSAESPGTWNSAGFTQRTMTARYGCRQGALPCLWLCVCMRIPKKEAPRNECESPWFGVSGSVPEYATFTDASGNLYS